MLQPKPSIRLLATLDLGAFNISSKLKSGNFIFKDYGKQVYTLYSKNTGKGVRVVYKGGNVPKSVRENRQEFINWLLSADEKDIIGIKEVAITELEPAKMYPTVKCGFCGELVMETRTEQIDGKYACIPCAQR